MSNVCEDCGREFDTEMGLAVHRGRGHDDPWKDKEKCRELYIKNDLTTREMAEKWDCGAGTVSRWLSNHGIEKDKPWKDREKMVGMYIEKEMSAKQIADVFGCKPNTVWRSLDEMDIETRQQAHTVSEGHDSCGYMYLNNPFDAGPDDIRIHRLVAYGHGMMSFEELLDPMVDIHHKDGVGWRNGPENLEVVSRSDHSRKHVRERSV